MEAAGCPFKRPRPVHCEFTTHTEIRNVPAAVLCSALAEAPAASRSNRNRPGCPAKGKGPTACGRLCVCVCGCRQGKYTRPCGEKVGLPHWPGKAFDWSSWTAHRGEWTEPHAAAGTPRLCIQCLPAGCYRATRRIARGGGGGLMKSLAPLHVK